MFITPVGRYCFNKLPLGISSAPEHFQRQISEILAELPGVVCQMDHILVFGKIKNDQHLEAVLRCIEEANVTLSPQKCEFSKTNKLTFLGHVIDVGGITADPELLWIWANLLHYLSWEDCWEWLTNWGSSLQILLNSHSLYVNSWQNQGTGHGGLPAKSIWPGENRTLKTYNTSSLWSCSLNKNLWLTLAKKKPFNIKAWLNVTYVWKVRSTIATLAKLGWGVELMHEL